MMINDSPQLIDRMNIKSCRLAAESDDSRLAERAKAILADVSTLLDRTVAVDFTRPDINDIFFSEDFDGWFYCFECSLDKGYSRVHLPKFDAFQFVIHTKSGPRLTATSATSKADWVAKKYCMAFLDCSQGFTIETQSDEPSHTLHFVISPGFIAGAFKQLGAIFSANYKLDLFGSKEDRVATHLLAAMGVCAKANELSTLGSLVGTFMAHVVGNYGQVVDSNGGVALFNDRQMVIIDEIMMEQLGEKLDIDKIAKALCMTKALFVKAFKASTDQTPLQHFNVLRMKKARELVKSSNISITNLAMDLGFTDAAHFSKSFNKYWKVAPSKLRSVHC